MASSFDMTALNKSLDNLLVHSKRSRRELVTTAAKGFVRDVVAITPPAGAGVKGAAAKRRGEAAVLGDLAKLAVPAVAAGRGAVLADADTLLAAHAASKTAAGRVNPRNRQLLLVSAATFNRVLRILQGRVGWLSAGWNAAASNLGVSLPAWVKRHGNSQGEARVETTSGRFRLTLTNAVGFVGNVRAYERRVQAAINMQAGKMHRQAAALLAKAARKAGFAK